MAAPPCRSNGVYIGKMGWERCKLEKCSTATVDYVWGCETLQNPTHPPHWLVNSFLPGWALPAIDSTPPPLLCSVIQTWKVNNKLTSSLVCILLWCSQTSNKLKADHLCLRNRYGFKKGAETGKVWSFCFIELCVDLLPDLHILHYGIILTGPIILWWVHCLRVQDQLLYSDHNLQIKTSVGSLNPHVTCSLVMDTNACDCNTNLEVSQKCIASLWNTMGRCE